VQERYMMSFPTRRSSDLTWDDAMQEVSSGRADYAVLPIENSSAGMVGDVCDLLVKYDNTIVDECYLKVEHALMGLQDASIEQIRSEEHTSELQSRFDLVC